MTPSFPPCFQGSQHLQRPKFDKGCVDWREYETQVSFRTLGVGKWVPGTIPAGTPGSQRGNTVLMIMDLRLTGGMCPF